MLEQKRFVKKLLLSLLPLGVAAGALLSCSNLSSSGTEGGASSTAEHAKFTGTGARVYVSLPGQGRSAAARSAVPSAFEDANGDLIFAGAMCESNTTPPPLKAAEYTSATASIVVPFDISSSARTDWVLELYAFPSDYDSSAGFDENDALLSVQILNIAIPANEESLDLGTVFMQPHSATATGSVSLDVTLPTGCDLSCSCDTGVFSFNGGKITATNIASGAHTVNFSVTKNSQTAYAWTEIIYVYPGMVTDAWNTGEGGTTERVIDATQMYSTFYVRGSGSTWIAGITSEDGDDTNGDGSLAKPYATVQAAVDKILAINDGNTEYTIYVDGTVTAASGTPSGTAVVNIASASMTKNLNLTISALTTSSTGKTAIIDGENTRRVILAESNSSNVLTLTLNDLMITKGKASASGGGIRANGKDSTKDCAKTKLYINRCLITQNNVNGANSAGGGIYAVNGDGVLQIKDSEISSNTATGNGGGLAVQISKGSDTYANACLINTKVINNTATKNGGGISITSSSYIGIVNCTQISGNTSTNGFANGIYINGTAVFDGVTNIENYIYGTRTSSGAVIQIASSNFALASGASPIPLKVTTDATEPNATSKFAAGDMVINGGTKDGVSHTLTEAQCNAFTVINTEFELSYESSKGVLKAVAPLQAMSLADAISALENATSADNPLEITVKIEASNQSDAFDALESLADAVYNTSASSVDLVITQITGTTAFGAADDTLYFGNKIKSLKIPEGIETIYALWFVTSGTSKLESVELPSTLKIIGEGAFKNCYELTSIVIPNGVTVIGDSAFDSCETLASVTLPNTLEEIGDYAFDGCDFTSIIIPASVTKIGYETFGSCSNLNSVEFTNTSGWKATDNNSYNGGSTIIVTDTEANANKLKSTSTTDSWCHKYLYRNP